MINTDLIKKELSEIDSLSEKLKLYIESEGRNNVIRYLYYSIFVYDYKGKKQEKYVQWLETKNGKNFFNKKLDEIKLLDDYLDKSLNGDYLSLRHDFLCLFVKELGILEGQDIPQRNVYSHSPIREYEPAKNAKNILKHGLSFRDIADDFYVRFGDLITHTHSKGENRNIYFSQIKRDNHTKFVMSVCMLPNSNIVNIPPLRFISARYFTEKNYEKVIQRAIQDENLDPNALEELKNRAVELIKEIYHFS
ncbi:BrnT family toxin [Lonepinella sp. BR2919]|uniref:BrnT family toxin n=1 Tax=unclassified Lonepinella TaxID=2642006 RepID=UPI003F6E2829